MYASALWCVLVLKDHARRRTWRVSTIVALRRVTRPSLIMMRIVTYINQCPLSIMIFTLIFVLPLPLTKVVRRIDVGRWRRRGSTCLSRRALSLIMFIGLLLYGKRAVWGSILQRSRRRYVARIRRRFVRCFAKRWGCMRLHVVKRVCRRGSSRIGSHLWREGT